MWAWAPSSIRGPLVPVALRRWVWLFVGAAAAWMIGIGLVIRHASQPLAVERGLDTWLARPSGFDHRVAWLLLDLGSPKQFVVLMALVLVGLLLMKDVTAAVVALIGVGLEVALVEGLLKPFFDRHLAGVSGATFPSGHTTSAFALATVVVLAANPGRPFGRLVGRRGAYAVTAASLVVASAIGLAMVVLQAHYLTDVLVGAPLGAAVSAGVADVADRLQRRRHGARRLADRVEAA